LELRVKGYHISVALVSLALVGVFCLKPPAMPQWDVDANVPLYSGTFRLVDLLDSSYFRVQADSSVSFIIDVPFDTVRPGEALDVFAVDKSDRIGLADFLMRAAARGDLSLTLSELAGIVIPDSGTKARLPPFENAFERECRLDRIEEAEIASGVVRVTCTNYTGLTFDSLVARGALGSVCFRGLKPGDSRSVRIEVGGIVVNSPMRLSFVAGSPGTGSDTVFLKKSDSIPVGFELDSLHLSSARMRMPYAEGRRTCRVGLGSYKPFRIDSLQVSGGVCGLVLENQFAVPVDVGLDVPKLGVKSQYRLDAKASVVVDLDLTGLTLDNRTRVNSLFDFHVKAVPDTSRGVVALGKSDGIAVTYQTDSLKTRRIAGEFREPVYVKSRLDTLPRLPYGIRGLRVAAADLSLDFENGIGFALEVCLKFTAWRDLVPVHTLEQSIVIAPGQPSSPVLTEQTIPLTDLINVGPDYITVEQVTRIMGLGSSEVSAYIAGRVTMSTPMRFAFVADTVATPAKSITMSEPQRSLVNDHLVGAEATLQLANHLPIGFSGRLIIRPDSGVVRDSGTLVDSVVIPFGVPSGTLDHKGNCVGDGDTTLVMELDSADASLLRTWPLNARVTFELPNSDTVTVRTTDRVTIDALLGLRVRIEN
jgi:hypothetical protein